MLIVRKLIELALHNPLVVILMAIAMAFIGLYSFANVNVEAYPDPAPAIVEVIAQFPGASAEEMERQVTIPLEVTFAGMPGLKSIRSQSLFGLSDLKMNWNYGNQWTYEWARQEVINRIATISQPLPPGVTPVISPESPTGEIYRYVLRVPRHPEGRKNPDGSDGIYTLNDIKALQDWMMERDFRSVQRIVDLTSFGGTVRRYEVQVDPDRIRRYGVTLPQLQNALTNSNMTVGGDYVMQGEVALTARSVGYFGGGMDPVNNVLGLERREMQSFLGTSDFTEEQKARLWAGLARRQPDGVVVPWWRAPFAKHVEPLTDEELAMVRGVEQRAALRAANILRAGERKRILDIRSLVITSINNQPIRVEDVVEGGRLGSGELPGQRGVVVSNLTRLGRVGYYRPEQERVSQSERALTEVGKDYDDVVQCIVLMRKHEDTLPALEGTKKKFAEVNDPANGRMLPGVELECYYDRSDLLHLTTETVTENLICGIVLVILILFMFVNNIRTALIVAINIPLALLFAFTMLFVRGKSANLLSIGAVDFGIIVDSSVIVVENIYRNLATGAYPELPMKQRILYFVREIDHALLFSTLIMVMAFIPLFTMSGPEGMLFAPMAQTYAFSLAGALVLSMTLTPVLSMYFFKNMKPVRENVLVRALKFRYFWKLKICLQYRYTTIVVLCTLIIGTCCLIPRLGHEFMPELEEGNIWVRATAPLNWTLERNVEVHKHSRAIMAKYPEVGSIVTQHGRPDDGTDTCGFYNTEFFVPLRPEKDWPLVKDQTGWQSWIWGAKRARTKKELVEEMNAELEEQVPGIIWNFSQNIRDNVMEAMSGVKGDNSLKIFGPDMDELENLASKAKNILQDIPGVENVGIFHVRGQSHLQFRVDPEKCKRWGVSTNDVNNVVQSALGASPQTQSVEGEKLFNISIRWPKALRNNETSILDIPVDIVNNTIVLPQGANNAATVGASGTQQVPVNPSGMAVGQTANPITSQAPRIRLRELVSPVGKDGDPDPDGSFEELGAADIYRENGKRMIPIKFSVRGRDLGSAVAEAKEKTKHLFQAPYRDAWSGEFEEMEEAEGRLLVIVPLSLLGIFILLYMAFHSILDTLVVFSNVFDVAVGGIWALYLTGTPFSVSAAVGFVSLFGVAIMEGLLLISYFNALRAQGRDLNTAIIEGATKRVRPVMITAMTAILGLLPAALSTKIGSQTQKPLAIVVVGGMAVTLLLDRYLMPVLYSFYGHREPPEGSGSLAH